MTAFVGWTPPPDDAIVPPPVHVETEVDLIFSDRSELKGVRAGSQNWSSVGDGPAIVAYAVVREYKPAPKLWEGWMLWCGEVLIGAWDDEETAARFGSEYTGVKTIHVREVLPAAREVVAWAVVMADGKHVSTFSHEPLARQSARANGFTVVKLTGVMPNE